MRKLDYIFIAVCCLVATACEVEFDLKGLDDDPLFLLDGCVGIDPYRYEGDLQMYLYAVPSVSGKREFSEEARCTLKVYKNSELIDIKDYITVESFYGLIVGKYSVEYGDEFVVTAESEGFPMATARTVIPQAAPVVDASYSMSDGDLNVRFSFEDDGTTEDAYAMCFRTISLDREPADEQVGTSIALPFGNSPESSFLDAGPFDVSWTDGDLYYGISDATFSGKRKEFEVTIPAIVSGLDPYRETTYFRIELQRISPERLRYEIACNDKGNNALGFIGLAPVTFAYTNVSGGSGCFSAASTVYTDWVEIQQ